MKYSSEGLTRGITLAVFSRKDRSQYQQILEGSNMKSTPEARTIYFKAASSVFTLLGVGLFFTGVIAMVLTLIFYGLLGFWFFFYYIPGVIGICIGIGLSQMERRTNQGQFACFATQNLLVCILAGVAIALFIASFSAINKAEYEQSLMSIPHLRL